MGDADNMRGKWDVRVKLKEGCDVMSSGFSLQNRLFIAISSKSEDLEESRDLARGEEEQSWEGRGKS